MLIKLAEEACLSTKTSVKVVPLMTIDLGFSVSFLNPGSGTQNLPKTKYVKI
jgi:hypothetical protein